MATILLVDDDVASGRAMGAFLTRNFPGQVTVAIHANAIDALDFLAGADVVLCLVDLDLGVGMSGRALIERAIATSPKLRGRFVVCSGWPSYGEMPEGCRRIDKPVNLEELRMIVAEAIGGT